ncbi:MAG: T9SS type A sorting domain-containing protein [Ignavibacteriales bacterium]|nr:T9SS type A sorting domain-containing protein [Ignavibacteriales bacterium]
MAQLKAIKEWTYIYDGPGHGVDLPADATIDQHGNFYMTGRSSGEASGQDIATLRISASGQEVLILRYNSVHNSWDEGNSLVVNESGNIFVVGTSYVTSSRTEIVLFKYSPSGSIVWQEHFSPDTVNSATASTVRLDSIGNIYVGGSIGNSFLILKYEPFGTLIRSTTLGDDSTSHNLSSFLIASDETLILAGSRSYWSGGDVPTVEFAVMATDTQGNLLWKDYLQAEAVRTLQLDKKGNVVLITHGDGTTAKYSMNGELLWYRNSRNSDTSIFILTGLAIDSQNKIIVGGYDCDTGCFDYAVMKYDEDGNVIWRRNFNSPDTLRDFSLTLAVDHNDAIYLTGNSQSGYSNSKCITVKYDSSGTLIWHTTYSRSPEASDIGKFIFVTDSGYVYVGGYSAAFTGWDYFVIRYRQDFETSVVASESSYLLQHSLHQNFPNPFNPRTTITYVIPTSQFVSLQVYDLLGQTVATIVAANQQAGAHSVEFDASRLPSGIYFYRLSAGDFTQTKKFVVLR